MKNYIKKYYNNQFYISIVIRKKINNISKQLKNKSRQIQFLEGNCIFII